MEIEEIFAVVVVFLIGSFFGLIILLAVFGLGFPFSGEHTGYITAVERGGLLNIPNLYLKTDNQSSQEDSYCVDEVLVDKAKELSKSRKLVTVNFSRGWFMPFWTCNSDNYKVIKIDLNETI